MFYSVCLFVCFLMWKRNSSRGSRIYMYMYIYKYTVYTYRRKRIYIALLDTYSCHYSVTHNSIMDEYPISKPCISMGEGTTNGTAIVEICCGYSGLEPLVVHQRQVPMFCQ